MSDTGGPRGIDQERVSAWLAANVEGATGPFTFDLIAGGHSNLTFGVTGADGGHYVQRRPPLDHVLATAPDMGREHRIISALQPTDVPVPPVLGLCTDDDVNGAPFYVMGYVDGLVLRDQAAASAAMIRCSRPTSCALASTSPSGGRRSTSAGPSAGSTR